MLIMKIDILKIELFSELSSYHKQMDHLSYILFIFKLVWTEHIYTGLVVQGLISIFSTVLFY